MSDIANLVAAFAAFVIPPVLAYRLDWSLPTTVATESGKKSAEYTTNSEMAIMGCDEPMVLPGRLPRIQEKADKTATFAHRCPICEKRHWVNQARHSVAWGRQFTCSCECEVRQRIRWREPENQLSHKKSRVFVRLRTEELLIISYY